MISSEHSEGRSAIFLPFEVLIQGGEVGESITPPFRTLLLHYFLRLCFESCAKGLGGFWADQVKGLGLTVFIMFSLALLLSLYLSLLAKNEFFKFKSLGRRSISH